MVLYRYRPGVLVVSGKGLEVDPHYPYILTLAVPLDCGSIGDHLGSNY